MTTGEFKRQMREAIRRFFGRIHEVVEDEGLAYVKMRFLLSPEASVTAWFNADTGRTSVALVVKGKRVFGVNNAGGWHMHPLDAPEEHRPIEPPTIEEAVQLTAQVWKKIGG